MYKDWNVSIQRMPGRITLALYIFRDIGHGKTEVLQGDDTVTTIDEGKDFKPTLTLFPNMLPALMKELSQFGVKMPEQSFIEGKLYATEKHLEDMRKIAFEQTESELNILRNRRPVLYGVLAEDDAQDRGKEIIEEHHATQTEEE